MHELGHFSVPCQPRVPDPSLYLRFYQMSHELTLINQDLHSLSDLWLWSCPGTGREVEVVSDLAMSKHCCCSWELKKAGGLNPTLSATPKISYLL